MKDFQEDFVQFMNDLARKLSEVDLDLNTFPIDHICYRVASIEEFRKLLSLFSEASILFTTKFFHDRTFNIFVLKEPFVYEDISIPYLEFSEPGGSDDYETGFQHIEFLTTQEPRDIISKEHHGLLCESKHGDETYLKWEDRVAVKFTRRPIITAALLEDEPKITLQQE